MAIRSSVFKLVGTAIAHSIIHCAMGMSCLAAGLFRFLITEDEEDFLAETQVADMLESETKCMSSEVSLRTCSL